MMKKIGYLLIAIGFMAGAYLASLDAQLVDWKPFLVALVLGFAGVAMVRVSAKKLATAEEQLAENISIIESSLNNLVEKVSRLNAEKARINTYDMRHKIDAELIDDLNNFADARETIGHLYGLHAYAEVMSNFAGGERYLNRIWSASADGYIDEVNEYLDKAQAQFVEAQSKLKRVQAS